MRWLRLKMIPNIEFLVTHVLHKFWALCALRAFHFVVNFLLTRPHTMVLPTIRGRAWIRWLRFKMTPSIEFLVMHVLRKFCTSFRTLRSTGFSPRCQLPFDKVTHYGSPNTSRKGMDALVTFQNDLKHRVPCYACFARFLRTLRSTGF